MPGDLRQLGDRPCDPPANQDCGRGRGDESGAGAGAGEYKVPKVGQRIGGAEIGSDEARLVAVVRHGPVEVEPFIAVEPYRMYGTRASSKKGQARGFVPDRRQHGVANLIQARQDLVAAQRWNRSGEAGGRPHVVVLYEGEGGGLPSYKCGQEARTPPGRKASPHS